MKKMILDATAGNRWIWKTEDEEHILFMDKQKLLQIKPDIFADNTMTPFRDGTFDSIFFDPPHHWGQKDHYYCFPRNTPEYRQKWKDTSVPRYYGWDLYQDKNQLISHIWKAPSLKRLKVSFPNLPVAST